MEDAALIRRHARRRAATRVIAATDAVRRGAVTVPAIDVSAAQSLAAREACKRFYSPLSRSIRRKIL